MDPRLCGDDGEGSRMTAAPAPARKNPAHIPVSRTPAMFYQGPTPRLQRNRG
jgi:hypothetical protein